MRTQTEVNCERFRHTAKHHECFAAHRANNVLFYVGIS